jgi:hypothetical protein
MPNDNDYSLEIVVELTNINDYLIDLGLEPAVTFNFEGYSITNPLIDVTAKEDVNPIEYYGKAFIESGFYHKQ